MSWSGCKMVLVLPVVIFCILSTIEACETFQGQKVINICDQRCRRERRDAENELVLQVRALLEHYKQEDPVGLPGAPIPDPVDVPDQKKSFTITRMTFKKIKVHGQSNFRFKHIHADLAKLEMSVGVQINKLRIAGEYEQSSLLVNANGNFTVNLTGVFVTGNASLHIDVHGQLFAEDIRLGISFSNIYANFENLGGMAKLVQGMVNTVGPYLFDGIKPFLLNEVNKRLLTILNENIKRIPQRFPNSIPPVDLAIALLRADIRQRGFDPYHLEDIVRELAGITLKISNIWVTGIASFHRVGEVVVNIQNNTANATFEFSTQVIEGSFDWNLGVSYLSKAGRSKFTIDYLRGKVSILQPLNVKKRLTVSDLYLKFGNIQMRGKGAGTLDYVAELVLNVVPNALRYQIAKAVLGPMKQRLRVMLRTRDIEQELLKAIKEWSQEGERKKQQLMAIVDQDIGLENESDERQEEIRQGSIEDFGDYKENNLIVDSWDY